MEKYNKVVEYYKQGFDEYQKVSKEQQLILKKAHAMAEKAVGEALNKFTAGLEEKVKDWSADEYDQLIGVLAHDDRLDSVDVLTIRTAYARTHKEDSERVRNEVCKKAILETAIENLNDLLASIGRG